MRWQSSGSAVVFRIDSTIGRAEREVRHEVPVHDVDVDGARPALLDRADLLAKSREVRGEDRRAMSRPAGGTDGGPSSRDHQHHALVLLPHGTIPPSAADRGWSLAFPRRLRGACGTRGSRILQHRPRPSRPRDPAGPASRRRARAPRGRAGPRRPLLAARPAGGALGGTDVHGGVEGGAYAVSPTAQPHLLEHRAGPARSGWPSQGRHLRAGPLARLTSTFTTRPGRVVDPAGGSCSKNHSRRRPSARRACPPPRPAGPSSNRTAASGCFLESSGSDRDPRGLVRPRIV